MDVAQTNSRVPLVIGIAGGTGSGKTTVAHKIAAGLPPTSAVLLEHDAYYRDLSSMPCEQREMVNYDTLEALETELLVSQLEQLRSGQAIEVPIYDFTEHRRASYTRRVDPAPVVIVEGILVLAHEQLRNLFDMKIFVDTDADIRIMRRVRRDMEDRGRDFTSIREQYYRSVRPMHLELVEPSKRWADLIVPEGGRNAVALDTIIGKLLHVLDRAKL